MKAHTHIRHGNIITTVARLDADGNLTAAEHVAQHASTNAAKRESRRLQASGAVVRTAESLKSCR